jgi:hypothetical protein
MNKKTKDKRKRRWFSENVFRQREREYIVAQCGIAFSTTLSCTVSYTRTLISFIKFYFSASKSIQRTY